MPAITTDLYRRACSQFATGVCIVTTHDGAPQGLTVNSFTSVSLRPPLVLICIDRDSNVIEPFRNRTHFAVNVLAESQKDLASTFAFKMENRFDGVDWRPGIENVPLLAGAVSTLECRLVRVWRAGDHDIFLGEVLAASVEAAPALAYQGGGYRTLT